MSARTYLLAGGAFAVGTSAYVVSGVLPMVSSDLGVSLSAAGQLATVFALSYAVGAPLLASVTGAWERRMLLCAALLTAGLGNLLAALAPNYPLLLAARVVGALGAAVYTPTATLFATALLPAAERGRAVARVFGGLTFALVIGVPAGSILAGRLGYRGVFAVVAAICLVVAVAVWLLVPTVAAPPRVGLRERFSGASDRRVLTILALTVISVLATMSVYTYVVPLLTATAGIAGPMIGLLLLVYGVGAVVGNGVGGRATDRFGALPTLLVTMVGFLVTLATLPLTAGTPAGASVALFVWAGFTWCFNPPVQNLLLELAPGSGLLLSLNASAIYLGAGLSGVVGGLVISLAGVRLLPVVGTALGVVALLLVLALRRTASTTHRRQPRQVTVPAALPASPATDPRPAVRPAPAAAAPAARDATPAARPAPSALPTPPAPTPPVRTPAARDAAGSARAAAAPARGAVAAPGCGRARGCPAAS